MYDDAGCVYTLPANYRKILEKLGIRCAVFNPLKAQLVIQMNNRDHRKICVIDGKVGFVGGINLADEYINAYEKYGHWKDTAVMLKGDAVWSLTVMFLQFWNFVYKAMPPSNYDDYWPVYKPEEQPVSDGYIQPFSDSPTDEEEVGATIHFNIINQARHYVYIHTPYLIIGYEMQRALETAAKAGVDVRITVPHVPDKKLVFMVTRANYEPLLKAGVKIYEYTPGFIHSKSFVSDDEIGLCGTTIWITAAITCILNAAY
ncbi:MAG: phospholipase D-like domain-containing protein [Holdemania massiliensis]